MGVEPSLAEMFSECKQLAAAIGGADDWREVRLNALEKSLNDLWIRMHRPGREGEGETDERRAAADYCILKHDIAHPKSDTERPLYVPSHDEINDAVLARKAITNLWHHGNVDRLDQLERKSLSSFAFGSNQFVLPPQLSNRVLSCLTDPGDIASLMGQESTSGGSLKFLIDHVRMGAAWACEAACFANNPQPDLQDGLGEMEIKAETLRFVACSTSDLLADSAFNIESWLLRKAAIAFRDTINAAIIAGDGMGKPLGLLHPSSGIPVCDTSPSTPVGQFTWQDVVMLAFEIPIQWHAGASYIMNQRTWALCMTMSDTAGRPLWGQLPGAQPQLTFAGFPVHINNLVPDVAPGATPIMFGNWREAYCVVNRAGLSMRPDPYSAGFCMLWRFEARIGGGTLCPNAARLLPIR